MLKFNQRHSILAFAASGMLSVCNAAAADTVLPFDGKTLRGWEIQGEGVWDVVDGAIHGYKSAETTGWGHLVSKETFSDGKVSLRYKVLSSNSGVYVRSHAGGDFGVDGLQIDIGQLSKDGLPMGVTNKEFLWLDIPKGSGATPGLNTTDAAFGKWNKLEVEVKGQEVITWLNGREIVRTSVDKKWMPAEGSIAFQLHSVIPTFVTPEVEVFFKDIEITKY